MTASIRQEWPTAWTAASATTVASGAAGSNCQVGNTIIAWVVWNDGASTLPTSVVDSASQTYTYGGKTIFNNNTSLNIAAYYFQNNASATALTITATWAAAKTFRGIWPAEAAGVSATSFQNAFGQSQDAPGTGTGVISSGNGTPSAQPGILYALSFDASANGASSVAGSLTVLSTGLLLSGNSFPSGTSAYQLISSLSAVAATFTNATDGGGASFLTGGLFLTSAASGGTATIAWVV